MLSESIPAKALRTGTNFSIEREHSSEEIKNFSASETKKILVSLPPRPLSGISVSVRSVKSVESFKPAARSNSNRDRVRYVASQESFRPFSGKMSHSGGRRRLPTVRNLERAATPSCGDGWDVSDDQTHDYVPAGVSNSTMKGMQSGVRSASAAGWEVSDQLERELMRTMPLDPVEAPASAELVQKRGWPRPASALM